MEEFSKFDGFVTNWFFNDENAPYYNGENFTKYNTEDGLMALLPEDDAATVHMGSDWRMPRPDEMIELLQNTDLYYISLDGNIVAGPHVFAESISDTALDGSKLRSLCLVKRGEVFDYSNRTNFVEFPFAGEISDYLLEDKNLAGFIWSNFRGHYDAGDAEFIPFVCNGTFNTGNLCRNIGRNVRGVRV
jgi:hypothetical protein